MALAIFFGYDPKSTSWSKHPKDEDNRKAVEEPRTKRHSNFPQLVESVFRG